MRAWCLVGLLLLPASPGLAAPAPASARISLDDLFAEEGAVDAAVSPSGRYLAGISRTREDDLLVVIDLHTGKKTALSKLGRKQLGQRLDGYISEVYWKTEDRLLYRVAVRFAKELSAWDNRRSRELRNFGDRLFAVDRDGENQVRMLEKNRDAELDWAFDLGEIRSMLPRDPDHILMMVDGEDGQSLFKVNVKTGVGEVVEHAAFNAIDWWLDLDGKPVVRVDISRGFLRFFRRQDGPWKQFYKVRLREMQEQHDYAAVGPSNQAGKFYVLARPAGAQRIGVYLYDLDKEEFGKPVAEHPVYDLHSAFISRDGTRVQRYCYIAHVTTCETQDAKLNAHLKGLNRFFKESANIYVVDSSENNEVLLLYVEGPSDPAAYYWYDRAKAQIERIGVEQLAMSGKAMPTATTIRYRARDGRELSGYLTRPAGATDATPLPLVVYPHGGPAARDHLTFDLYVQYFASQGYAVFQPNFRGSEGFGREHAESGFGEWGRKMQDDISDGLAALVEKKLVDPARVCIVGASYGGYAALAGVSLTPDLYQCAVSIAGVGDLEDFLNWRRKKHGADSELYAYWKRQIGDPDADVARITAVSPARQVDRIKAPILLIHGDADDVVPISQSKDMKARLDKSGRHTQLIKLKDEGHSDWSEESLRLTMTTIRDFLNAHIGPGTSTANN